MKARSPSPKGQRRAWRGAEPGGQGKARTEQRKVECTTSQPLSCSLNPTPNTQHMVDTCEMLVGRMAGEKEGRALTKHVPGAKKKSTKIFIRSQASH